MCQQIVQFCSGSTKPLLFAGCFLTLLLAIAIGYTSCSSYALYKDIDQSVAQEKSLSYYLELAAAGYLVLIALFGCFAAYYDQKHLIRALAIITALNFVFSVAAIAMVPDNTNLFADRLKEARSLYNFADKTPLNQTSNDSQQQPELPGYVLPANGTIAAATQAPKAVKREPLTTEQATRLWDKLQQRGCCGFKNATEEWQNEKKNIPKSCCAEPKEDKNNYVCSAVDDKHEQPCIFIIGATTVNLLIVLALVALVSLYLATVTGVSTYRTFHYNEASQNAYS